MSRCPVCNTRITPVKNETIFGGSVTLGYECSFCGYWTGMKRRVPQRYVFSAMVGGKRDVPAVRFMDLPDNAD
jgi:DNA-directed RNA polymerase subunit RPC12/RpoP